MLSKILLFSFAIGILSSCNGQNEIETQSTTVPEKSKAGNLVDALSEKIWYVFQDTKNNYWFLTNGDGVYRLDGKDLTQFTTKNGLSNDTIRQIQEDKLGNIYFATFGGVDKFDGKTITSLKPVPSNDWKLQENDLWFSVLGKIGKNGPYRYDGKVLHQLEFPKHYLHDEMFQRGITTFFNPYDVYCIYKDRIGAIWFGTAAMGACRFDGESVKWMYEEDLSIVPSGGAFGIRSIFEDSKGNFWICNTNQKFKFNFKKTAKSDRLVYTKTKGIGSKEIFGENYIYYSKILQDKQGNIWFCTWSQGVYKYDGKEITRFPVLDNGALVYLVSMFQDNENNLWLGTNNQGVYKFNGTTFERFIP